MPPFDTEDATGPKPQISPEDDAAYAAELLDPEFAGPLIEAETGPVLHTGSSRGGLPKHDPFA